MRVRFEWFLLASAAGLLAAGFLLGPKEREELQVWEDAWDYDVFYRLVRELHGPVRIHVGGPLPPQDASMLCYVGTKPAWGQARWRRMRQWIAEGHSLLVAVPDADPEFELGDSGLEVSLRGGGGSTFQGGAECFLGETHEVPWRGRGTIRGVVPEDDVLVRGDFDWPRLERRIFAVRRRIGRGTVVLIAGDWLFHDLWMHDLEVGVLAFRLFEAAERPGTALLVTPLSPAAVAMGEGGVTDVLFKPPVRYATFQILAACLLLFWAGAKRFGPLRSLGERPRRRLLEHARALGALFQTGEERGRLALLYAEFVRRRLHGRLDAAATLQRAEFSDLRNSAEARLAFRRAEELASQGDAPAAEVARVLRELSALLERRHASGKDERCREK